MEHNHMEKGGERMTLYRVSEVADQLRVTTAAVYHWIKVGRIAPVRIGPKVVRVSEEELKNFLTREAVR
jgi:excisionase family DNA binding protein